jgi:hypothetical protein
MPKKPKGQHVEVIARTRPLNQKELGEGDSQYCVVAGPPRGQLATVRLLAEAGPAAPGIPGPAGSVQTYHFNVDKAFYEDDDNAGVFTYLGGRVLDHAFGGLNVCLLAYGQTGSGKTHTILGDRRDPGLIPRLSEEIFERVGASDVRTEVLVEMVEIYGKEERMTDLLSDDRWCAGEAICHTAAAATTPARGQAVNGGSGGGVPQRRGRSNRHSLPHMGRRVWSVPVVLGCGC